MLFDDLSILELMYAELHSRIRITIKKERGWRGKFLERGDVMVEAFFWVGNGVRGMQIR